MTWNEPVGNGEHAPGRPRVSNYPTYVDSAWQEAVGLAASAGLHMDAWQQYVLRHSLGERADGSWSAFEVGLIVSRQNGKGSVLEARELAGLLLFGDRLILHTAHELKTAMEHKRRIESLFLNYDDLRKRVKRVVNSNGDEGIEFTNGSRLRFVARSRGSGRGFSGDLIVLDEAFALTAEQVGALMPTLSARPNPQIWYTTSPPLDAVTGSQIFSVRRRGESDRPGRLAWFDYGNPGQLDMLRDKRCGARHVEDCACINLDDPERWESANPAHPHRVSREFIEQERAAMDDVSFARERLGIWPPDLLDGFQVIPEKDWETAEDRASEISGPLVLCVAAHRDRESRATIAACGRRADGLYHVEVTSKGAILPGGQVGVTVDSRPGTGWVIPRLLELRKHRPVTIMMDSFGATGSLIAAAKEAGLPITEMSTGDVAKAYGMFHDGVAGTDLAARNIRHLGQPELTNAVAGAIRRPLGDGFTWDRRSSTVDITPVLAVTGALYGYALHGHVKPVTPWVAYA
jgi:hypothetical protein